MRPPRGVSLGLLAIAALLVVEAVAWIGLAASDGRWPVAQARARERAAVRSDAPEGGRADTSTGAEDAQVLHPYVGYVTDPAGNAEVGANGFFEPGREACAEGDYVVELYGGSLANRVARTSAPVLADALSGSSLAAGRDVCVVNLGMAGYKQPQQQLLLAYRLALGERPDAVLNLDGFNELALPVADNAKRGIHPWYPRLWAQRVAGVPDIRVLRRIGERVFVRQRRFERVDRFASAPWRWSAGAHLLWRLRDRADAAREAELDTELAELSASETSFLTHGPGFSGSDPMPEAVAVWERSSLIMHRLCRTSGIRYLHALQPNQYYPDTKPFGTAERSLAIHPRHPYGRAAQRGYPLLLKGAERLRAEGVRVADLTRVFTDVSEPLYADNCCHLTAEGNDRLASALAEALANASVNPTSGGGAGTGR